MLSLFSCRNCIQNCGQSMNIGRGDGFCLQHGSVISEPDKTTCKYLHRKDLPKFAVDEGMHEHALEFALFPELATLDTKQAIPRKLYSEKYRWEQKNYDPVTNAIAQYFKIKPAWAFIQSFAGGLDGRRSLVHAAFVRRYLNHCDTWVSSYRLTLALIHEIDMDPVFLPETLVLPVDGSDLKEVMDDARWDVIFCRLSGLQEYGWHAGIEQLLWASDSLNGALSDLNWEGLKTEMRKIKQQWIDIVIEHAKEHKQFFSQRVFTEPREQFADMEYDSYPDSAEP